MWGQCGERGRFLLRDEWEGGAAVASDGAGEEGDGMLDEGLAGFGAVGEFGGQSGEFGGLGFGFGSEPDSELIDFAGEGTEAGPGVTGGGVVHMGRIVCCPGRPGDQGQREGACGRRGRDVGEG